MKKYFLITMLLFVSFSIGFGQVSFDKKAVLKSLVIPGWGEMQYNQSRGRLFLRTDATLLVSFLGAKIFSDIRHNDLINYATQYANTPVLYENNNQYLVDIGTYVNYEDHKEDMLENRTPEKIYDENYTWNWDSIEKANTYRDLRIGRDLSEHYSSLLIGAMVFNRILSAIDVIYLSNVSQSLTAYVSSGSTITQINISLQF